MDDHELSLETETHKKKGGLWKYLIIFVVVVVAILVFYKVYRHMVIVRLASNLSNESATFLTDEGTFWNDANDASTQLNNAKRNMFTLYYGMYVTSNSALEFADSAQDKLVGVNQDYQKIGQDVYALDQTIGILRSYAPTCDTSILSQASNDLSVRLQGFYEAEEDEVKNINSGSYGGVNSDVSTATDDIPKIEGDQTTITNQIQQIVYFLTS